jgi:hypothetical protein
MRRYRQKHRDEIRKKDRIYNATKYREARRRQNRIRRAKIREEGLAAYGGEHPCCQCECGCKEDKPIYLDLDHANNDGAEHRREISNGRSCNFYPALKKRGWPKDRGIRVMCIKCNIGRYRNGGQCPELGVLDIEERSVRKQRINKKPERTLFTELENESASNIS